MIERAIENWLINTNERNYQVAFCQVLLQKGHKVVHVSSHRPMEQGKDIITIGGDGDYYAYQLKTGHIDLKTWRKILGEVKELVELPIVHPSVDKTKVHKSFLVTNGDITDEVRIQIDQINEDNQRKGRGYSYLDVINGKTLLKEFISAQGEFLPKELKDFDLFLKLFLADGTDFLSKDKYFDLLNNTIFSDIPNQKSNAINAISSSIIIASYLLNPYQIKKNYYALFEAWTSLAACIVRYARRIGLKKEDWIQSLNLVMGEILRNLSLLKEETLERKDFLEGNWRGDGGFIYRARATIVLGTLAALETHHLITNDTYTQNDKLLEIVKNNIPILWYWGESAFPYFFSIIKYLELNHRHDVAISLLNALFLGTISENSPRKKGGLPNPYYGICDVLEAMAGINIGKVDFEQFSGSSYILKTIILMIARRNGREILERNWRTLSHIRFEEFKQDDIEDIFLWRTQAGVNYSDSPQTTKSWTELVNEAKSTADTPQLYSEYLDLLRFFILVCPHRVNAPIIQLLDMAGNLKNS